MVTAAQIKRFASTAKPAIVAAIVENWDEAEKVGLTTPLRIAHFFARAAVETGGLSKLEESLNYTTAARIRATWPRRFRTDAAAAPFVRNPRKLANHVYNGRMGNVPGTDDGWDFRGGGMMQTTGREGFRAMGFEDNPEALREPTIAFLTALKEWKRRKCNAMANRDDVEAVCVAINGGKNGLKEQRIFLARAKKAFAEVPPVGVLSQPGVEPGDHIRAYDPIALDDDDADTLDEISFPEATAETSAPITLALTDIEKVQHRLRDLGYFEVGEVDGLWGGRTTAAVAAFQKDRKITVTGGMNEATLAELGKPGQRPIAAARAEATPEKVRAEVPAAKESWFARQWAKVTGIGAAGIGVVSGAADALPDAAGPLRTIREVISDIPPMLWASVVAGVCLTIYVRTKRAGDQVTQDYQTGRRT
jgi:predicted chitinase